MLREPVANDRTEPYVYRSPRRAEAPGDPLAVLSQPMTPAYAQPAIPPVPNYLGSYHPGGPGIHPLLSPPGVDIVGLVNEHGIVDVQVTGKTGALSVRLLVRLYALLERFRSPRLRRLK